MNSKKGRWLFCKKLELSVFLFFMFSFFFTDNCFGLQTENAWSNYLNWSTNNLPVPKLNSQISLGQNIFNLQNTTNKTDNKKSHIFPKKVPLQMIANILGVLVIVLVPMLIVLIIIYAWNVSLRRKVHNSTHELHMELDRSKNIMEKLRQSQSQYEKFVQFVPVGMIRGDRKGDCVYINQRWTEFTGLDLNASLGQGWRDALFPEDSHHFIGRWKNFIEAGNEMNELTRFVDRSGIVKWVFVQGLAEKNSEGKVTGFLGSITDMTAQKEGEVERRRLERQIQEAQKIESLGILAGGIAHDFNNLLSVVIGNADMAMINLKDDSPEKENLIEIKNASLKASDLTQRVLAYSGKGRFLVEEVNFNEIVQEVIDRRKTSLNQEIEITFELSNKPLTVKVDKEQIKQVLIHLINNAVEAIGQNKGTISLRTKIIHASRDYLEKIDSTPSPLRAGEYVCLDVIDTGSGMEPHVLSRMFEPFFSTKFTGRGLGLAAVQGIARGHYGATYGFNNSRGGATFRFLLPFVSI